MPNIFKNLRLIDLGLVLLIIVKFGEYLGLSIFVNQATRKTAQWRHTTKTGKKTCKHIKTQQNHNACASLNI